MTRDEIIDMAREAWCESGNGWATSAWFRDRAEAFETFAKKVEARAAAAEREACARLCEAQIETGAHLRCAKAIRARGAS